MGYANPMLRRGPDWFAAAARAAGIDGVICVAVPPEEDDALGPALRAAGIHPIRLATPTTDAERLPAALHAARRQDAHRVGHECARPLRTPPPPSPTPNKHTP